LLTCDRSPEAQRLDDQLRQTGAALLSPEGKRRYDTELRRSFEIGQTPESEPVLPTARQSPGQPDQPEQPTARKTTEQDATASYKLALAFARANKIDLEEDHRGMVYGNQRAAKASLTAWQQALPKAASAYRPSGAFSLEAMAWMSVGSLAAALAEAIVIAPVALVLTKVALLMLNTDGSEDAISTPAMVCVVFPASTIMFLVGLATAMGAGWLCGWAISRIGRTAQNRNIAAAVIFAGVASIMGYAVAWGVYGGTLSRGFDIAVVAVMAPVAIVCSAIAAVKAVREAKFCERCRDYMQPKPLKKMRLGSMRAMVLTVEQKKRDAVPGIMEMLPGDDGELILFPCRNCQRSYVELVANFSCKYFVGETLQKSYRRSWRVLSTKLTAKGSTMYKRYASG